MSEAVIPADQTTINSAVENTQAPVEPVAVAPTETAEVTPEAPKAVESYDLKLPEGSKLKPERVEDIKTYAKAKGLSSEAAQELLQREASLVDGYYSELLTEHQKITESWKQEVVKDSEIGGEKMNENIQLAQRALERWATPKLIQELESTGYGNHPEVIRLLTRIGKAMSNDKMVSANSQTGGVKSYEERLYGKQT